MTETLKRYEVIYSALVNDDVPLDYSILSPFVLVKYDSVEWEIPYTETYLVKRTSVYRVLCTWDFQRTKRLIRRYMKMYPGRTYTVATAQEAIIEGLKEDPYPAIRAFFSPGVE